MTEFKQQRLGFPWSLFNARLDQLAWEYLKNTEDYDHRRCQHRVGKLAMPITPDERRDCIRFAEQEYMRLRQIAESERLDGNLRDRVRRLEREFTKTYVPPIPLDTPPHSAQA